MGTIKLMGGVILMAIVLYQPQKWIMPYGQNQKQGFVKMKKSCKDFILLQLATYLREQGPPLPKTPRE